MQKPVWLSKSWWIKHKGAIAGKTALVAGVVGTIALLIYRPDWTGFGPDSTKSIERDAQGQITKTIEVEQSGKTLWDWLSVLGVPLSLAILGFWFQQREQKRSNQQAELEKEIAATNQREEALQAYFDRLSTLLVDKNLIAVAAKVKQAKEIEGKQTDPAIEEQKELLGAAVDVIRARTLSILRQFGEDGERKTSVIRFLLEAEVIGKLDLNLRSANLSFADLRSANLRDANLSFADLRSADLRGANLIGANLRDTNLSFANLSFAQLIGADLIGVHLIGADLISADLRGAYLNFADLVGADLSFAHLSNAEEQLNTAKLCKTQLPGGCNLDPDRDCLELELSHE